MDMTLGKDVRLLLQQVALELKAEFNETPNGTMRIIHVLPVSKIKVSIVFLPATGQWKVFKPFPAVEQERIYFPSLRELLEYAVSQ